MSSLNSLYIKKETLKTLYETLEKKNEKGVSLTVSINDEPRVFEHSGNKILQNVSAFVSQSKEERDNKKQKFYVGNGKTFWTDGKISVPVENVFSSKNNDNQHRVDDDLPY